MFLTTAPRGTRARSTLGKYVARDVAAARKSANMPTLTRTKPARRRFLGAMGCASCAGTCGGCKSSSLGDWSDWGPQVIDSVTNVAKAVLPVVVNDTIGPGSGSGLVYNSGPQLTPQQIAALNAANAGANANAQSSLTSFFNSSVNIGGVNVPYWALGLGGLGAVFALTR